MHRSSRTWSGFAVIALAVQLCGGMLAAQTAPPIQSPGQTPTTIVLPGEIPVGESASLSVLDSEGRLVPGAVVQLSSGTRVTTDSTGRALFLAPRQGGTLAAQLPTGASFTTSLAGGTWTEEVPGAPKAGLPRTSAPEAIALGDRLALRGRGFHPDAARNRVTVGGQSAVVLASSSVSLIALPNPRTPLGKTEIAIEPAGGSAVRAQTIVVSLAVTGPTRALAKGKKDVLQITVSGTKEKILVEVRNLSPDVVKFPRGDAMQLKTSGGANNIAKIEITSVNPGEYAVSARLAPAVFVDFGLPAR